VCALAVGGAWLWLKGVFEIRPPGGG
jgi:hypothetical protein